MLRNKRVELLLVGRFSVIVASSSISANLTMSVIGKFSIYEMATMIPKQNKKRTNLSFVTHVDSNKVLLYSFLFLGKFITPFRNSCKADMLIRDY